MVNALPDFTWSEIFLVYSVYECRNPIQINLSQKQRAGLLCILIGTKRNVALGIAAPGASNSIIRV
jgi:hypothetical protein